MRRLSPVVASGGHSSLRCAGLSLSWPFLLWSTGSRHTGSVVVVHGPSCSAACGIFPDQGLNPCPPHWQADSQPLHHQGSPKWNLKLQICLEKSEGDYGININGQGGVLKLVIKRSRNAPLLPCQSPFFSMEFWGYLNTWLEMTMGNQHAISSLKPKWGH